MHITEHRLEMSAQQLITRPQRSLATLDREEVDVASESESSSMSVAPETSWEAHFDKVATQEGIWLLQHKKNKLRVALVPMPANNIAALTIVFTVGSKSERTGMTGSAHILEHELFKKFPGFDIWHDLGDYGARINASTSKNRTEFHEILTADRVMKALELEALRMRSAPLTGLLTEKVVVRNEFERSKNHASSFHREIVYLVAMLEGSTIGTQHDIEEILNNRDRLQQFKNKYYCCANAAIVLSGTFDADQVLDQIHAQFGDMPAGESTREGNGTDEAAPILPQKGMRSVDTPGEMPMATLSFRVGDGMSREAMALELVKLWFSSGVAGPFADMLQNDPELHGVEGDFDRVHGISLFSVWIIPISGGDAVSRIERLQRAVMTMLAQPCPMTDAVLADLKTSLRQQWRLEVESAAGYTSAVVESFARANTPFDVVERHHVLDTIELRDVKKTWTDTFVTHRMTVGRVLPELTKVKYYETQVHSYKADGDKWVPLRATQAHRVPFDDAVVTSSGVYLVDPLSSQMCLRVHMPTKGTGNAAASLSASLSTVGVKLSDGEVLKESQLHKEFTERGAAASVTGNHSGVDVRLDVRADEDVERLVHLLKAGVTQPLITDTEFERKQHFLSETAVGSDYDVSESARRLFSRCLYHHDDDPRRLLTGAEEGKQLLGMSMQQALSHVQTLGERGAWVTCVAPSQAHCRLVREAFESPSKQAQHDESLQPPGAGPYSGRVVTLPLQGKTSATMLMGCASGISPADENALPLSLAVDALGGSFTSRLMAEVREKQGLTYGINAGSSLSDPHTTTTYVVGTFAPSLLERGVKLTKDLVRDWRDNGITQEELDRAKTRAIGSANVAWDAPHNVADALHAARLHFDAPAARCKSLADRVRAVTLEDCQRAVEALPAFDDWVCVCAGAIPAQHTM